MIGGGVLNAATFFGGNYLVKVLGSGHEVALDEVKAPRLGSRGVSSGSLQILARAHPAPRLDPGERADKSAGQAKLHQHRLCVQALQRRAPR